MTLGKRICWAILGLSVATLSLEVGTRLRVGEDGVLLEVCYVRTPCNDFKGWMGETGHDPTAWVKRFAQERRPGPYLRVLAGGTVGAGDAIEVVHAPGHGITVRDMFIALNLDRSRLPELLDIEGLTPKRSRPSCSMRPRCARRRWFSATIELFSRAFCASAAISAGEKGLVTKSYAPRRIASSAASTVEWAVITTTSVASLRSLAAVSTSRPEPSGITRSVSTSGNGCGCWRIASRAVRAPGAETTS